MEEAEISVTTRIQIILCLSFSNCNGQEGEGVNIEGKCYGMHGLHY